jgi:ABC-2 type transport system permease protein
MNELNAVLTVASREVVKLVRDPGRLAFTVVISFVWIGLMGGALQNNLGRAASFDFIAFYFTGVLGGTLFLNAAQGLVSLIQDRESDFSQEMFVAPVSCYSIVLGKVLGESLSVFLQGLSMIAIALLLRVPLTPVQLVLLLPASFIAGLLGGAFGLVIMSLFDNQRAAQQIFPVLSLPQFFLAGVLTPIKILPWYLSILSIVSPMRYGVDLVRNVAYAGRAEYWRVVLFGPLVNLSVMAAMFVVFLAIGSWLFVRRETNR